MFSDHNRIKLRISNRNISGKYPNIWKLNNIFLNNPQSKRSLKEIRIYFELNKNKMK